ncbi:hypothetical protein GOQ04_14965 [Emticicia sp. ODNR4P]|nr:hypothetical protein [Emticicia sp. ODNR4P]
MAVITQYNAKYVLHKFEGTDRQILSKVFYKIFPDAAKTRFENIVKRPDDASYQFNSIEAFQMATALANVIKGTEDEPLLEITPALLNFIDETPIPVIS